MPFGASRLNTLAKYFPPAAGAANIWDTVTNTDDQVSLKVRETSKNTSVTGRSGGMFSLGYSDRMYMVADTWTSGALRQQWGVNRWDIAADGTATFAGEESINTFTSSVAESGKEGLPIIDFPTTNQAVMMYNQAPTAIYYFVFGIDGSDNVTVSDKTYTNTVTGQGTFENNLLRDPDGSETDYVMCDRVGNIHFYSFDTATSTISLTNEINISNVNGYGAQSWIIETSGTNQICVVYYNSVSTNWEAYRVNFDGTGGTVDTLVSAATLGQSVGYGCARHQPDIPTNKSLYTVSGAAWSDSAGANGKNRAFGLVWDGTSSWTVGSIQEFDIPDILGTSAVMDFQTQQTKFCYGLEDGTFHIVERWRDVYDTPSEEEKYAGWFYNVDASANISIQSDTATLLTSGVGANFAGGNQNYVSSRLTTDGEVLCILAGELDENDSAVAGYAALTTYKKPA